MATATKQSTTISRVELTQGLEYIHNLQIRLNEMHNIGLGMLKFQSGETIVISPSEERKLQQLHDEVEKMLG